MSARNANVLYIDSGIGGLPYFMKALERYPQVQGVYCADTGCFPYGNRSPAFLQEHLEGLVSRLRSLFVVDVIVLACNTASVVALERLRALFPEPILGTVPAIKPAVQADVRSIGVLASAQTAQHSYLNALIQTFANNTAVHIYESGKLISSIEENMFTNLEAEIQTAIQGPLENECQGLVLGCTHFSHVAESLRALSNNRLRIFDSSEGITRQLGRQLKALGLHESSADRAKSARMYVTSPTRRGYYERVAEHFKLEFHELA